VKGKYRRTQRAEPQPEKILTKICKRHQDRRFPQQVGEGRKTERFGYEVAEFWIKPWWPLRPCCELFCSFGLASLRRRTFVNFVTFCKNSVFVFRRRFAMARKAFVILRLTSVSLFLPHLQILLIRSERVPVMFPNNGFHAVGVTGFDGRENLPVLFLSLREAVSEDFFQEDPV
jgi:hypothetical protein